MDTHRPGYFKTAGRYLEDIHNIYCKTRQEAENIKQEANKLFWIFGTFYGVGIIKYYQLI